MTTVMGGHILSPAAAKSYELPRKNYSCRPPGQLMRFKINLLTQRVDGDVPLIELVIERRT